MKKLNTLLRQLWNQFERVLTLFIRTSIASPTIEEKKGCAE